ncbi:MurR/RpiR family transcriptional regulator [Rhodoglobus sp. NPDC076762]
MTSPLTLAEQLKKEHESLSPAERRVSRVLIADYPVAGLEPVHRLAERANVSAPTVLRLISKLGIGSYPQMQKLLRQEISARTSSPLEMYGERSAAASSELPSGIKFVADSKRVLMEGLEATFSAIPETEILEIVKLIANPRNRIWTVGGRFSDLLAQYLNTHLRLLRKDVNHVRPIEQEKAFALLDFTSRDVLIAFDYRRYQGGTVSFLKKAKQKKATTVLFTDPWLSPAAKHADYLLSSSVTAPSPFDSLTSGFALVETVIAGVVEELGDGPTQRIQAFDSLQEATLQIPGFGPGDDTETT